MLSRYIIGLPSDFAYVQVVLTLCGFLNYRHTNSAPAPSKTPGEKTSQSARLPKGFDTSKLPQGFNAASVWMSQLVEKVSISAKTTAPR